MATNTIKLKEILAEHKIYQKQSRRKLRKAFSGAHELNDPWIFTRNGPQHRKACETLGVTIPQKKARRATRAKAKDVGPVSTEVTV